MPVKCHTAGEIRRILRSGDQNLSPLGFRLRSISPAFWYQRWVLTIDSHSIRRNHRIQASSPRRMNERSDDLKGNVSFVRNSHHWYYWTQKHGVETEVGYSSLDLAVVIFNRCPRVGPFLPSQQVLYFFRCRLQPTSQDFEVMSWEANGWCPVYLSTPHISAWGYIKVCGEMHKRA